MVGAPLVAVDVGNARIKLGLFAKHCAEAAIPEPLGILSLLGDAPELDQIGPWLAEARRTSFPTRPEEPTSSLSGPGERTSWKTRPTSTTPAHGVCGLHWWIASVNRPAASRLIDWLHEHRPADHATLLACGDLPLTVRLPRPDMVGIDRLVDAVAVNRLRRPGSVAAIVDVGSAITVDLVSADGAFLGGAILPGIAMSARALHEFTDLLPLVDVSDLSTPPPALGTATEPAIESGLFWGSVGAIRELVERLGETATGDARQPQVFLTGGAGAAVARLLGPHARYVPHLTLAGIALAAGVEL